MPAKSKSIVDTLYLQRIGNRWYCRVPVPNRLRGELGPYLRKALDTSDLNEARKRRWDFLPIAKAQIGATERRLGLGDAHPAEGTRERSYAAFRARLAEVGPAVVVNVADGNEMYNPSLDALVDKAEQSGDADEPDFLKAFKDHVKGRQVASETLKDYLDKNPKRSATTEANYATTVRLWIEHQGDRPLHDVTRSKALDWLNAVSVGKARDTIKRYATVMSHLWLWVYRAADERPRNPFEDLTQAADERGRATESYDFFSDVELVRAYEAIKDDDELRPLFLISIYTGFRLNECLVAERTELGGVECFLLVTGKSKNAARALPVHAKLKDIKAPTGMKASALSVRFGRTMRKAEIPEGKTFHSLRKSFTTALERSGCPEALAARLLGHAPLSITYGIYSKGRDVAELREWVDRVSHPV